MMRGASQWFPDFPPSRSAAALAAVEVLAGDAGCGLLSCTAQ
jgi:hypothetical protein